MARQKEEVKTISQFIEHIEEIRVQGKQCEACGKSLLEFGTIGNDKVFVCSQCNHRHTFNFDTGIRKRRELKDTYL